MPPSLSAFLPTAPLLGIARPTPREALLRQRAPHLRSHATRRATPHASETRERDPLLDAPLGPPLVVCVGETLFDLHARNDAATTSHREGWTAHAGGAPANLATALARLRTASALVGCVGDDDAGQRLVAGLEDGLVNVDGVQRVPLPTREVFVRADEEGENCFVAFSAPNEDFADTCELDADALPGLLFYAAQILVAPTLGLAFPGSRKSVTELVQLAHACKLRVVVDINWRPVFWKGLATDSEARERILTFVRSEPGADFVKMTVGEVRFLLGEKVASQALEKPELVLRALGGRVTGAIVTAGAAGAAYAFTGGMQAVAGRVHAISPPGGATVDSTGAGDAFLAGFLSEMLRVGGPFALTDGEKTESIMQFAAAVAACAVEGVGAVSALPDRERVEGLLGRVSSV